MIPLHGRVPNVRTPRRSPSQADRRPVAAGPWTGPRIDHAGSLFFRDGHSIEQVSLATQIPEHRLVRSDLRTWLERHGMGNAALISALIDHPVAVVRRCVFRALSKAGDGGPDLSGFNAEWVAHVAATYTDPDCRWGYAACPDDLGVVQTAATRIACPHRGCQGHAARVVLLPETSASGYGVICTTCRRMPNPTDPKWARIVFPPEYVALSWTASPERPRPAVGRTVAVDTPAPAATAPFTVKHRYPGRVKRAQRGPTSRSPIVTLSRSPRAEGPPR